MDGATGATGAKTLEQLYDTFSKAVYWASFGVLHDREAAADVMQNVFLRAHKHMETLTTMSIEQQRAWLYRSAVNASIDTTRRNKHTVAVEDAGLDRADDAPGPEESAAQNETRNAVRAALMKLPEKYRQPLTLYYFADMDYKEIAPLLDINEGTLKSRMSRGRALMEKELRKGGGLK